LSYLLLKNSAIVRRASSKPGSFFFKSPDIFKESVTGCSNCNTSIFLTWISSGTASSHFALELDRRLNHLGLSDLFHKF
jgi:hypothetical protein